MSLLLDTHALLWWLADDPALGAGARTAISDPDVIVQVSAVSAWEIAIKRALGKLSAPSDLEDQLRGGGFVELAVTVADGLAAGALPRHHDDPFDRMLIAQAHRRDLTIVTRDPSFAAYGARLLAADR